MAVSTDTIHIADEDRGRDENDDVTHALCGKRVRLSDMKHWFGMSFQVNCEACFYVLGEN